ncbi:MAG TPA: hypothetical protein VIL20_02615, partial [Sandaracinaceae bacterium]
MQSKRIRVFLSVVASASIGCMAEVGDVGAASEALRCPRGYEDVDGRCDVIPPRRIAPLTGAMVNSDDEVTFEYDIPAGVEYAIVEI